MHKHHFYVNYSDGKFWIRELDDAGEYESEVTSWKFANDLANGQRWSVASREKPRSRKWKCHSGMTLSIDAQLWYVAELLKTQYEVNVLTPDVCITFFKA